MDRNSLSITHIWIDEYSSIKNTVNNTCNFDKLNLKRERYFHKACENLYKISKNNSKTFKSKNPTNLEMIKFLRRILKLSNDEEYFPVCNYIETKNLVQVLYPTYFIDFLRDSRPTEIAFLKNHFKHKCNVYIPISNYSSILYKNCTPFDQLDVLLENFYISFIEPGDYHYSIHCSTVEDARLVEISGIGEKYEE